MNTLATNRNHFVASQLYALAADARRSALKNDADPELAAIQADQARRMRDRAIAVRNGARTSEYMAMNTLTTNRNHMIAARFYALASAARREALDNCIAWIERGTVIPPYCRIDTAAATYHANQARVMKARAAAARNGTRTY